MMTRREFLASSCAAVLMGAAPRIGAGSVGVDRKVHLFSKHLQWLDYEAMAETAAQLGFDGIDLTVRPGGHVLPEQVSRDLPRAVSAIRNAGLTADRITTALVDPGDPATDTVLGVAADQGIGICRLGWLKYDRELPLPPQIDAFRAQMERLAQLLERHGMHGAYQNHAGTGVGSPVWDAWLLVRDIDPRWLGIRYDIRHAVAEGSRSWELGLQLLAPHIRSLDIKDFRWLEQGAGDWTVESVPLGQGAVPFGDYFEMLDFWRVSGDATLHLEYPLGGAEKGASRLESPSETVLAAMRRDLAFLRTRLSTAR
jgi:sugar phosphate isomerase/epimerase